MDSRKEIMRQYLFEILAIGFKSYPNLTTEDSELLYRIIDNKIQEFEEKQYE
jgi:hypothetical protein